MSILLAASVQAAVDFSANPQVNVDYKDFREDQQTIISAGQFTLRNTDPGNVPVQLSLQLTAAGGYSVSSFPTAATIPGNGTFVIDFALNVPHKNEPGNATIGTIQVRATDGTLLGTANVIQETAPMLIIRNLGIDFTDKDGTSRSQDLDVEDDDDFRIDREVKPGTDMILTFEIENRFRDGDYEDSDIENIELSIDADDSDIFPSDFQDTYDFADLRAKDKESLTVRFTIPDDAANGNYNLEFTLEGEDGANINYKIVKTVDLDLERPKDDVRITNANVTTDVTACDTVIPFLVELKNYGSDNQRYTALRISGTPLRISENLVDIEIDQFDNRKDTWSQTFSFPMPKVSPGTYPVDVYAYIDRDEQMDYQKVDVEIKPCPASVAETPVIPPAASVNPEVQTVTVPVPTPTASPVSGTMTTEATGANRISSGAVVDVTENPYSQENFLVGLFIVAIVLVLALIVIFFIILLIR